MRVAMIGSGYVGLVSGACFADFGHDVVCVDKDPAKIERLRAGIMPIYEPGLPELVTSNAAAGRLTFTTSLADGIKGAEAIFIAVGTPARRSDGHADLSYVHAVAAEIGAALTDYAVIVTKSTVPVGTGDEVERIIDECHPAAEFSVVSNPEFLREGAAIENFMHPDRIVIGTDDDRAKAVMTALYLPMGADLPLLFTGRRTSELIKYAANAFLATKITFINEIADLCEVVGGNVQDVSRGIGLDTRIGAKFLNAGPGYGGSCFPKDTLALVKTAQDAGAPIRIVETVAAVNEQRKRGMAKKVIAAAGGSVRGKTVAVLGLTFKPDTDDMRDSPAIDIVQALQDAGARIQAHDPEGEPQSRLVLGNITYKDDPYDCLKDADIAVLITEWAVFRNLDLARVKSLMKTPAMVDLRNIYKATDMAAHGIAYSSVGR